MPIFIAWGNIQQNYPFAQIPPKWITKKLSKSLTTTTNDRIHRRQRGRWIAHFLLWQLLNKAQISGDESCPPILYSVNGRPYFPSPNLDFNFSHSGDWVAVVLSTQEQQNVVGIDIEEAWKDRKYQHLLEHFASVEELNWFFQQENESDAFYQIWCGREAVLKSQGIGIAKLTEVHHNPELSAINSIHCPVGNMVFSCRLPFYLAVFSAGDALRQASYWNWNGESLQSYSVPDLLFFSVNN